MLQARTGLIQNQGLKIGTCRQHARIQLQLTRHSSQQLLQAPDEQRISHSLIPQRRHPALGLLQDLQQFIGLTSQQRWFQIRHPLQFRPGLGRARGHFQQALIGDHPAARPIGLHRVALPPCRQGLQTGQGLTLQLGETLNPAPGFQRILVQGLSLQGAHFLIKPSRTPKILQFASQRITHRRQIANIIGGIIALRLAQRTPRPVGPRRPLGELHATEGLDQLRIGSLRWQAAQCGGNLGIENRLQAHRKAPGQHFLVLAAGMQYLFHPTAQKPIQHAQIERHLHVDQDQIGGGRCLNQAQFGIISTLAHELGIQGEEVRRFGALDKGLEFLVACDHRRHLFIIQFQKSETMYSAVAQRLAQILTLKSGPQDLPTSLGLLQFSAAIFLLFAILRMALVASPLSAIAQSVLSLVVLALFVRSLLRWRRTPERFTQTMTALLLTGGCIGALLLLPLNALRPVLQAVAENPSLKPGELQVPAAAAYAWAGLSLWGLVISGHIYRHALGMSLGLGLAVALIYEFLLVGIIGTLGSLLP